MRQAKVTHVSTKWQLYTIYLCTSNEIEETPHPMMQTTETIVYIYIYEYSVYSSFSGWSRKALEFNVPHCFKSEASNFQHQQLALSWKSWWFAAEFTSSFKCFKRNLQLCPEPVPGGPTLDMVAWLAGPSRPANPRPPYCIWWAIWSCMDLSPRFSHWYVLRWHLNWSVI